MKFFEDIGLSPGLVKDIAGMKISEPTLIQEKSIPHIINNKDVIGQSATGSGKTLAFGCGVVEKTVPGKGLQALILTPTRELAEQVKNALIQMSYSKRLKIISIYGGVAIGPQIDALHNADVVVATPGRFLDHVERRTINNSKIKLLVLDEVDRMLDMGFIDDVQKIIRVCPRERQTLIFSATISSQVIRIAEKYMKDPIRVEAERMVDPAKLKQVYYDVPRNMKMSLLIHLLRNEKVGLVMVFCNTRRSTDFVVKNLRVNKVNATAIHGGLSQQKRSRTIKAFNDAKTEVLVCTDVAARGLHIPNVSHVYNYEIPHVAIDYIHRIGRTARVGEEGKVINLLADQDHDNFSVVLRDYRDATIEKVELPKVERIIAVRQERSERSRGPRRWPRRNQRQQSRGRKRYRR